MDKIYDNCCGIDVHKKLIVAFFRKGNKQEVRESGATTRELLELTGSKQATVRWLPWRALPSIGSPCTTSLNLLAWMSWWSMPAI